MPLSPEEPGRTGGRTVPHHTLWSYANPGGDSVSPKDMTAKRRGDLPETGQFQHGEMWRSDEALAFDEARQTGRGVLIDFYAMWCSPCLKMDSNTFQDPEVQLRINNTFVPLRIDVTEETKRNRHQLHRYGISELPTIVLLDPTGAELTRIVEYASASEMLSRLAKAEGQLDRARALRTSR